MEVLGIALLIYIASIFLLRWATFLLEEDHFLRDSPMFGVWFLPITNTIVFIVLCVYHAIRIIDRDGRFRNWFFGKN